MATREVKELGLRIGLACVIGGIFLTGYATGAFLNPVVKTEVEYVRVEVPSTESGVPSVTSKADFEIPLSANLQSFIKEKCFEEDVPFPLVYALIEHESSFNADAVSDTGDSGLMQINEINADKCAEYYSCTDLFNPYQNVYCGIKMLSGHLKACEGDVHKALMSYNMGSYGASKLWEDGVITSDYSRTIVSLAEKYSEVLYE